MFFIRKQKGALAVRAEDVSTTCIKGQTGLFYCQSSFDGFLQIHKSRAVGACIVGMSIQS